MIGVDYGEGDKTVITVVNRHRMLGTFTLDPKQRLRWREKELAFTDFALFFGIFTVIFVMAAIVLPSHDMLSAFIRVWLWTLILICLPMEWYTIRQAFCYRGRCEQYDTLRNNFFCVNVRQEIRGVEYGILGNTSR